MSRTEGLIVIENARIKWPNFTGIEKDYNPKGSRNFCVALPEDVAEDMARKNYNVKRSDPKYNDPDENGVTVGEPYVQVKLRFDTFHVPEIFMVGETTRKMTPLDEETVTLLDRAVIVTSDIIISPFNWKPGAVTAYLREGYFVIEENMLKLKYADTQLVR